MFNVINLNDPQVWVAVSFLLFFIIFGSLLWKKFSNFLDNRINDISEEILVASNLHQEAKNLLSEEKKKLQGLDSEINIIIEEGKLKAQNLYNESKEKINKEIMKLEKSAKEKIKYLENEAVIEIQNKISKHSIKLTEKFLEETLSKEDHSEMISNSINELEKTLAHKNKFIQ
jgi:F-type H+-transporting ATPase subunit b